MNNLLIASFYVLSLSAFVSVSLGALHHILLFIPAIFFTYKGFKNRSFLGWSHFFLGLFVIVAAVNTGFSTDLMAHPIKNVLKLKYFLLAYLGTYAVYYAYRSDKLSDAHLKRMLNIFLIATTIATISGLIAYYTGLNPLKMKYGTFKRASGLFGMVLSYSYALSFVLTGMIAALFYKKETSKFVNYKLLIGIVIINFAGLYLSYSRGPLIALIVALPFIFLFKNKKMFWSLLGVGCVLLSVIGFIFVNGQNEFKFYRLDSIESDNQRKSVYLANYYMIKDHFWTGVGFRNSESMCGPYKKKYDIPVKSFCGHAHSNYLEIFSGTGVFGFIFFMLQFFFLLKNVYGLPTYWASVTLPMLINFLISGASQSTIIDGEVTFIFFGFYMLVVGIGSNLRSLVFNIKE